MLGRPQQRSVTVGEADATPLVMLPGTLCDERLYTSVLDHLGREAHVPTLDGADSAAEMARQILVSLPRRFALVGFSLGGIVALEMAAQAPERVERLALIGCNPGKLSTDAAKARAAQSRDHFVAASREHTVRAFHELIGDMAAATPALAYRQQTAITLSRADSWPRLAHIAVATLIVCGADDVVCPPELSREMAAAMPHARLALIEGAGHYVTLEQPEAVAAEIAAWLATPIPALH